LPSLRLSIPPPLLKNTFPGKAFTIWDAATASNWWMAWRESHLWDCIKVVLNCSEKRWRRGEKLLFDGIAIAWESILDTQIAAVVDRLEASPRSVQVRDLGYRWGSCGHKGDLYFHWPVAMLPRTMIEYVAHELVHLIEPNHNHAFWDRLERMVSDWCDRKRWLAQNGASYDL